MRATADVALVIPTHNRLASVQRTLSALCSQTYPRDRTEIIVVADGCSDGTVNALTTTQSPLQVRVLEQASMGPAAARNRGARAAVAPILIFLDDDIEPASGFVEAHVGVHSGAASNAVAIGYLPADVQGRRDFFAITLRAWWEAMFERMREAGHRFAYSDLLSGNFSVGRALFERLGGFDESLRCHEDYELGLRLIAAGAQFTFVPDASGWHHERTDLARALQRKRDEGRADVALARQNPALAAVLPFAADHSHLTRRGRVLKRLARMRPTTGDVVAACCRMMLRVFEGSRLRDPWRRLLDDLLAYWYWRGLAEALAGAPLSSIMAAVHSPPPLELDLRGGLNAAMRELDAARPASVRLRWGAWVVGTVLPHPGAEQLAGRHLPHLLRTRFFGAFADTISLADALASFRLELEAASHETACQVRRG